VSLNTLLSNFFLEDLMINDDKTNKPKKKVNNFLECLGTHFWY